MKDTDENIKAIQLGIWLSKTPGERLLQLLNDNEALFMAWKKAKEKMKNKALKS